MLFRVYSCANQFFVYPPWRTTIHSYQVIRDLFSSWTPGNLHRCNFRTSSLFGHTVWTHMISTAELTAHCLVASWRAVSKSEASSALCDVSLWVSSTSNVFEVNEWYLRLVIRTTLKRDHRIARYANFFGNSINVRYHNTIGNYEMELRE